MVTYPEGGMPGLLLKQQARKAAINSFRVQLVPLRAAPKAKITGPESVAALVSEMEDYDRESAKLIHLDTKNQVMGVETISIGSLNMSIVHPRETVKGAILNNSANVIFVHNHPSGICEPSPEDDIMHTKLTQAFEIVGIKLLDSVIVGKGCYYAFSEGAFARTPVQVPLNIAPIVAERRKKAGEKELERREKERAAPPPFRRLVEPEYIYETAEMREYKYTSPTTGEVTIYYRDFELERVIIYNNLLPILPENYFDVPPPERGLVFEDVPTSIALAFQEKVSRGTLSWEILTDVYGIPRSYIERWIKLLKEGRA